MAFGLRQGQILHISEVPRGKNCACICPACERPLVAHKGNRQRGGKRHHFKHLPDARAFYCAGNQEGAIHQFAKQCVGIHRVLTLPPVARKHLESTPQRVVSLDAIVYEKTVTRARYRPDATADVDARPLLIEFENTHPVGAEKVAKIIADNLPAVEIKLLGWFGERKGLASADENVIDWILHKAPRTWLWHPDFHHLDATLEDEERRAAEAAAQRLAEERLHQQQFAILRQETARQIVESRRRSSDDLLNDIEQRHSTRFAPLRPVPPPQLSRRHHMTDARIRELVGRVVSGADAFRRPAVIWQKEFIDYCFCCDSAPITVTGFLTFLASPTRMWLASDNLNHAGLIEAVSSYAQILIQDGILCQSDDGYRLSLNTE